MVMTRNKNTVDNIGIDIEIDYKTLTIMGVPFPDEYSFTRATRALGSSIYEGFVPTTRLIEIYRDYAGGKIPIEALPALIREAD